MDDAVAALKALDAGDTSAIPRCAMMTRSTHGDDRTSRVLDELSDSTELAPPGRCRRSSSRSSGTPATTGWDQPARLFALVPTVELVGGRAGAGRRARCARRHARGPDSGRAGARRGGPVVGGVADQDRLAGDGGGRARRGGARRPAAGGRAAVPDDPEDGWLAFAAEHPEREDVRIAVGVLRSGEAHCVLRLRSHDDDER